MDDIVSADDRMSMTGYEFMLGMLEGRLPLPPIARLLGFRLREVEHGRVVFGGSPKFEVSNPMGTVHGGWYATVLDSAMACAVMTQLPKNAVYTTLEIKVNFVRPAPVDQEILAEGNVLHFGRSTAVAEAKIFDGGGRRFAMATTTCIIIRQAV